MPTWTTASTPNTGAESILDICSAGARHFVAVGTAGTVLTSSDGGATWTARTAAAANNWNGVAFNGTTVVAVATNGASRVMVSTDLGVTWTSKTAAEANSWASVTYAAFLGMFIAVASNGVHRVMTSTDSGSTWTARTAATANDWSGVAASPTSLLAFAPSVSATMTSTDGIAWASATSLTNFTQLLSGGSNTVVYSTSASKFALPGRDTVTGTAKVSLSTDGAAWTDSAAAPLTNYLYVYAFVSAPAFGGFIGSLPFNAASGLTPTIIAESTDAAATWTADDTTRSGLWQVGAWDNTGSTVVFWDANQTNTMLVGTVQIVTAISPSRGTKRGGTVTTLTGSGLASVTGVSFGGTPATGVVASATSVTCLTPAHATGTVSVTVS